MTRYRRDTWYVLACHACADLMVVTGAQVNAGKRFCSSDCLASDAIRGVLGSRVKRAQLRTADDIRAWFARLPKDSR